MKLHRIQDAQAPVRKKHKSKKKHGRILRLVRFLLITSLLTATIIYGALSPFFNIKEISVRGKPLHNDAGKLLASSGIVAGENGFRLLFDNPGKFYFFRIGTAERAILDKCPYVKSAKVRFLLPSQVTIEVTERNAAAVLTADGTSLLIDGEEVLLEVDPDLKKLVLPVIKVRRPSVLKPGKRLELQGADLSGAFEVYGAIKEMDKEYEDKLLPDVDYVDVSEPGKVGFSLKSRLYVNLGSLDELNYKLNAVKTIYKNNIKKDEKGKLDFTSDGNTVFTPENGR